MLKLHFPTAGGLGISLPGHSQVLRDSRTKESSEGVSFTSSEMAQWKRQITDFFNKPRLETGGQAKKRKRHQQVTAPRLASLDWMRSVEHGMEWATGKRFSDFQNVGLAESSETKGGVVELPKLAGADFGLPPLLAIASDQYSVQLCSIAYMEHALKLNLVHMPDPFHMSWNDVTEACAKAGFQATVQASLVVFNIAYGPFQRGAFFNDLRAASVDIPACLDADDPLLTHLWPAILTDKGMTEADDLGRASRAGFLLDLPFMKPGEFKGPKASTSRWYSFLHSQKYWDDSWHSKLLLLVWVSIRRGWAQTMDDVFSMAPSATASSTNSTALVTIADASRSATARGASSSSSSSAPPVAASSSSAGQPGSSASASAASGLGRQADGDDATRVSKSAAIANGKQVVDAMRSASANTMHAVARMMANPDFLSHIRIVAMATQAFAESHGQAASKMSGPKATMRFYVAWAHWPLRVKCSMNTTGV